MKTWHLRPADKEQTQALEKAFDLHPVIARILSMRELGGEEDIRRFLRNDLNDLTPPFAIKGLESAAERLSRAVQGNEHVLVYGDYDVDGITATSILIRFLAVCGLEADFFIPDRIEDGYGITSDSVAKAAVGGPDLVVTVDCGITAVEPVRMLQENGIDVIITDHHLAGDALPETPFVVNPKLAPGTPFENLAAAGVAFKLAWGTAQKLSGSERVEHKYREFLVDAIPLAALGTVADLVPLTGENRILVAQGLAMLPAKTRIKGLHALIRAAGIEKSTALTTFDIGFKLGPRLNAAGRMDNASKCVDLLCTESVDRADAIAAELDQQNRDRQKLCERTMNEAVDLLEAQGDPAAGNTIVAGHPDWHRGVIGIVASKLTDRYNRPAIVLAGDEDGLWHGSARSVGNFHITDALRACSELLEKFGGHQGAAGLSLTEENLETFKAQFEAAAAAVLTEDDLTCNLEIEAEVARDLLDISLAYDMRKLEPFGEGNRQPLLVCHAVPVARYPRLVGSNDRHLKLHLAAGNGRIVDAIGFGMGSRLQEIIEAETLDMVFFPSINEWQGRISLDLLIKDFKPGTPHEPS